MTYRPLSTVLGSVADGAVVPSAYGDQCRDNQVALHAGWHFQATGAVSQTVTGSTWSLIQMNAVDVDGSNLLASEVAVSSGYVSVSKPGVWMIGTGGVGSTSNGGVASLSVSTTTGQTVYATHYQRRADGLAVNDLVVVSTVPTLLSLWWFTNSTGNLNATVVPFLYGFWLGTAS